jgi:hypothetical protein
MCVNKPGERQFNIISSKDRRLAHREKAPNKETLSTICLNLLTEFLLIN